MGAEDQEEQIRTVQEALSQVWQTQLAQKTMLGTELLRPVPLGPCFSAHLLLLLLPMTLVLTNEWAATDEGLCMLCPCTQVHAIRGRVSGLFDQLAAAGPSGTKELIQVCVHSTGRSICVIKAFSRTVTEALLLEVEVQECF